MDGWNWGTPAGDGRISLGIVGDTNIQDREDPASAFAHVMGALRGFDALVGQWECPLTEAAPADGSPEVGFKPGWRHSRPAMARALTAAGFDAVSLASNVAYPPAAAAETARHLDALGIAHAGAGADRARARAPAVVEASGTRIALLSYTSVFWPIEQPATETTPGVATIRAHTAYSPGRRALEMPGAPPEIRTWADPAELEALVRDVEAARREADLVVVSCHWGVSSQEEFVAYQREIAHAAIDAGAGLVYGTHPHRIQAVEVYRGAPVFYSLGNFAFDWPKMRGRHLDGLMVRCLVERGRVAEAGFVPVRRGPDNDVRILDPRTPEGAAVVARTQALSEGLGTRLEVVGAEVRIGG
jgi:poly-gamma-glutamate synthesis protein (capsule biosynthesis protein)